MLSNHFDHAVNWAIESEPRSQGCREVEPCGAMERDVEIIGTTLKRSLEMLSKGKRRLGKKNLS